MDFRETDEQRMLRDAVDGIASKYGHGYFSGRARTGGNTDELWNELARAESFTLLCAYAMSNFYMPGDGELFDEVSGK